ncbi:MAG: radical SAM protein, partial [Elusimicrobia bacterium]|nr:radical SAM protein [Elusimicrobiota bacterium]MBD3412283.1 radical SAM protein [Elusimicrobiota bacterium]
MPIIEPVIRPPSEAGSLVLQVTVGCSGSTCTFCGAYQNKRFVIKDETEICDDIHHAARQYPNTRRVFLLDGDALAFPHKRLIPVLDAINQTFPRLTRIASYANGYNITRRNHQELEDLAARKLRLIYMGLESGSQQILDMHRKPSSVDHMINAVRQAEQADIK